VHTSFLIPTWSSFLLSLSLSLSLSSRQGLFVFLEYPGASWKSMVRVYHLEVCDKILGIIVGEIKEKRMSCLEGLIGVIVASHSSLLELRFSLFSLVRVLKS
jgi:hypothetical protein